MEALPEDRVYWSVDYSSNSPGLSYQVEFVTVGTHYVWVRGLGPSTSSDSLHVGLNGVEVGSGYNFNSFLPSNTLVWSGQSSGSVRTIDIPSMGVHMVNVWMRESGMVFDKLVLTTDSGYVPVAQGPAESTAALTVTTPVINPNGGIFSDAVTVTLATSTAGADIFYTTDGSDPSQASTLYTAPFDVTASATVKAVGYLAGYNPSAVASADFVIRVPVLPPDMTQYWQFDEVNPGVYNNIVSGANDARCTNCPISDTGLIGNAQVFDGVSDELNVVDDSSFGWVADSRFSIEFWVKKDATSLRSEVVIGRHDSTTQLYWWAGLENGKAAFYLIDIDGNGQNSGLTGITDIADGVWHQIVVVRDSVVGENRLYIDGLLEDSSLANYTAGFDAVDVPVNIGWLDDNASDFHFEGAIDELGVYNRVLSDQEIYSHYLAGSGLHRRFWDCDPTPIRIMPLGDSITVRPGYRPSLYFDLVDAGYAIDFVGSRSDGSVNYDPNYEAYSGATSDEIAASLYGWLSQNPPEIIVLHIGTNDVDLTADDVSGVENILNVIDSYSEDIIVVLALIINRQTYHPLTTDFNIALEMLAETRILNGDKIIVVDHENALIYPDDMSNEKHPNDSGYAKMATEWFNGLRTFLPNCLSSVPEIISEPVTNGSTGMTYTYDVQAISWPPPVFELQKGTRFSFSGLIFLRLDL
jgi:hypothetical protein